MAINITQKDNTSQAKTISFEELVTGFKKLGVQSGYVYNVKASLKSLGFVEGGAKTVIDALLEASAPNGTLVTDSFIAPFPLPLSPKNAKVISSKEIPSYAGAIANAMLNHPKAFHSSHPIQRFAAVGSRAEELMKNHTPQNYAYDVLRVIAKDGTGKNIKIGPEEKVVGYGTTHVAIGEMGFIQKWRPLGINYIDKNGDTKTFQRNWSGGCAEGFGKFLAVYREKGGIDTEGFVGNAPCMISDMATTLQVEIETLSKDPAFFMCDNPACVGCRLTWEFSNGNYMNVLYHRIINKISKLFNH